MWINVIYNQVLFTTNWFRLTGWKQPVKLWLWWRQFVWLWHCFDNTARNQWFSFKCGNLQQSSDCQFTVLLRVRLWHYGTKTVFLKSHLRWGALLEELGLICRRCVIVFWREATGKTNVQQRNNTSGCHCKKYSHGFEIDSSAQQLSFVLNYRYHKTSDYKLNNH